MIKKRLQRVGLRFGDIFPVLLTDNGGEFSNVLAFENKMVWKYPITFILPSFRQRLLK